MTSGRSQVRDLTLLAALFTGTLTGAAQADSTARVEVVVSAEAEKLVAYVRAPLIALYSEDSPLIYPRGKNLMLSRYAIEEERALFEQAMIDAVQIDGQQGVLSRWMIDPNHPRYSFSRPVAAKAVLGLTNPSFDVLRARAHLSWELQFDLSVANARAVQITTITGEVELHDFRDDPQSISPRTQLSVGPDRQRFLLPPL